MRVTLDFHHSLSSEDAQIEQPENNLHNLDHVQLSITAMILLFVSFVFPHSGLVVFQAQKPIFLLLLIQEHFHEN